MLHVFLAGDMAVVSRFYEFAGFFIRSPLFYVTVACLPFFLVRAIQRNYWPEIGVFALAATVMIVQILHFATLSRQPPNFNSVAQYYPVFSFVVFACFLRMQHADHLLRTVYHYSCWYVLIYVVASSAILLHLMPQGLEERLTQSDPERGARILIIASSTLYCLYYSYFKLLERVSRYSVLFFLLALVALLVSQSRLLIVIVALVSTLSLRARHRSTVSTLCFAGFVALSAVILYGMAAPDWNPFVVFGDDTSARIRTEGYETVRRVLWSNPSLGAGISANDADMVAFTSNPTLSAADLGPIGIWFVFGLAGLALYIVSVYVQCFCTRAGGCGSLSSSKAVQYTGCVIAFFGCLTPTWFNGSLVGLFIALYLRRNTIRQDVALQTLQHVAADPQEADPQQAGSFSPALGAAGS